MPSDLISLTVLQCSICISFVSLRFKFFFPSVSCLHSTRINKQCGNMTTHKKNTREWRAHTQKMRPLLIAQSICKIADQSMYTMMVSNLNLSQWNSPLCILFGDDHGWLFLTVCTVIDLINIEMQTIIMNGRRNRRGQRIERNLNVERYWKCQLFSKKKSKKGSSSDNTRFKMFDDFSFTERAAISDLINDEWHRCERKKIKL